MGTPAGYPIESVDNATRTLLLLRTQPSVRITEVADVLEIARSSAHRLLMTLQARDMLQQDPTTKAFFPGTALIELGSAVAGTSDLRSRMRQLLDDCAKMTNETVHLCTIGGTDLIFIDGIESSQVIRAALRSGSRLPAHRTAAGRAMLAATGTEELHRLYPDAQLSDGTSRDDLETELAATRDRGFGINLADSEEGLHAVGVSISDTQGRPRAGVSISGPAFRLDAKRLSHLGRMISAMTEAVVL